MPERLRTAGQQDYLHSLRGLLQDVGHSLQPRVIGVDHPRARIYHYANYEIAALCRLTAEHRVGEAAMDQLQRERRFVDLFKVVSGSLIASEKGY